MEYRGTEYKWYKILFVDGKPDGVELYKNSPFEYKHMDGKVTTYWNNEQLTNKPLIQ